jgi:outer membrane receptor protein involved in Fe transport
MASTKSTFVTSVKLAVLVMGTASFSAVHADDRTANASETGDGLQEITVTATRQSESLSKVPISVSVLTAASMEERHIKDISDVVRFTPGLTVDAGGTNDIAIRGISSSGGAGTTGIYIDDVPIQLRNLTINSDNTLIKVFDLDRIEVLRGPQGTLFGSGSEGGTVRYITTQPSLTATSGFTSAETSYTEGGTPNYEAGIAGGTPIIDGVLGVRASAWFRRDGGWIDRVDPLTLQTVDKNANRSDTTAIRLAMLWQASDAVKVTPSIFYQNRQHHNDDDYWPLYSNPSDNRFISGDPTAVARYDKFYLPSLNIEARLGPVSLTSTTSYFHRTELSGGDDALYSMSLFQQYGINPALYPLVDGRGLHIPASLANVYQATNYVENQQRNFTQEFRLQSNDQDARLRWTVGVFYAQDRQASYTSLYEPDVDPLFDALFGANWGTVFETPLNADGSTYLLNGNSYTDFLITHDRQIAGFGEANYKITDALMLTAGMRIAKSDVYLSEVSGGAQPNYGFTASHKESETPKTPKATLSYQLDSDNLFYATYAKGFRPGGGNPEIPYQSCSFDFQNFGIQSAPTFYNSDSVQSYEVGAKNKLNDRIRVASSIYYIKWHNIQQNVLPKICAIPWTQNLGEAVSKGFDLQADVALSDALKVSLTAGFTDARYTANSAVSSTSTTLPIVSSGDAITGQDGLPIAPWTGSLGAQYSFVLLSVPSFVRADYQYSSAQKWSPASADASTLQFDPFYQPLRSWQFVSMRAESNFGAWSAALFVDNLFDSHVSLSSTHTTPGYSETGAIVTDVLYREYTFRPRTFGISARYQF